jgi:hypothetical protein
LPQDEAEEELPDHKHRSDKASRLPKSQLKLLKVAIAIKRMLLLKIQEFTEEEAEQWISMKTRK